MGDAAGAWAGRGEHLLLYDGVCALCDRAVRIVLRSDRRRAFDFASLQSPAGRAMLERFGVTPGTLDSFYIAANYRSGSPLLYSKGRAVIFLADTLGGLWRAVAMFRWLPASALDALYTVIARNRYRLFGRYDACPIPLPEHRARFLDQARRPEEGEGSKEAQPERRLQPE